MCFRHVDAGSQFVETHSVRKRASGASRSYERSRTIPPLVGSPIELHVRGELKSLAVSCAPSTGQSNSMYAKTAHVR